MIIRKANINDYNDVIKLYKQLHDTEVVFDDNINREFLIDEKNEKIIKNKLKSRKYIFLVAEVDNKIVGLLDGYIIDSIFYLEKIGYLDHLCVDEEYRNNQIGSKLIKEFINISKKKKAKYIKLNAFNNNKSINLYKRLGFKEYSSFYISEIND